MSSTALKLLALVLMLLDHVALFIPGMPVWMHYVGRASAPIFMFCLAEGFKHTGNKIRYLKRLYIGSAVMGVINTAAAILFPDARVALDNNIFATLFLIGLIITVYEKMKSKERDGMQLLVMAVISQIVSIVVCFVVDAMAMALETEGLAEQTFSLIVRENASVLVNALIPNLLFCEGGYLMVLFGFMMYYYGKNKKRMSFIYVYMCVVYAFIIFFTEGGMSALFNNYQWMMILATPFFLIYNGEKGQGLKYLFYIFYPVHLIALFLIGNVLI